MNPLLQKQKRRVVRVPLPNRPDLNLFVRAITGIEFAELGSKLNKAEGAIQTIGIQLETYVCDEEGNALLAAGEGAQFMEAIESGDMRRLKDAGDKLNAVNDEAVEDERKN